MLLNTSPLDADRRIELSRADITTLKIDAIVTCLTDAVEAAYRAALGQPFVTS